MHRMSGLGNTVFGRLLMNFYFFVQIALLRVDSVVGPAELFPPQGNIVAPAPDSPVDGEPSWKAAPQVPLPYHVVNRVTHQWCCTQLRFKTEPSRPLSDAPLSGVHVCAWVRRL
ncbi:hypothetical protein MRX96_055164 [Rhipicephalus microplus]